MKRSARWLTRLFLTATAAPIAACGSDDGPGGALERALAHTRPMPATRPAGASQGGPGAPAPTADTPRYRVTVRAELVLDIPGHAQRVAWTRTLDREGSAFRFLDGRGWERPSIFAGPAYRAAQGDAPSSPPRRDDDQVEALFDGTRLAMRHADGPWIARDVLDGLPSRLLDKAADLTDLALRGFGDYLQWEPLAPDADHSTTLVGESVTWLAPRLDPAVSPREASPEELTAWRDHVAHWPAWLAATHRPTRVSGQLARLVPPASPSAPASAEAPAPASLAPTAASVLACDLHIEGTATVEGTTAPFTFELHQAALPLPADANFDWPSEVLPAARQRPWHMIVDVLGDSLAAPYAPDPDQKNVPTPAPK